MKKVFILATILLLFGAANAQIGDTVKRKNSIGLTPSEIP